MWIVTDLRKLRRGALCVLLAAAVVYAPGKLRRVLHPAPDTVGTAETIKMPETVGTAETVEPPNPAPTPNESAISGGNSTGDGEFSTQLSTIVEKHTVILDAGHGGEDGGAVSPEGVPESGINLAVALRTGDLLRLVGQRTAFTRETEASLADPSLPTIRARKNDDLRRRAALVNGTEGAVLISIHQNSLPSSPATHGAQVFWNGAEGGQALAECIQGQLNRSANSGNGKQARPMGQGVYLMAHADAPAALVECGFLSNGGDAAALQTDAYQLELALAVAEGFLLWRDSVPR